MNRVIQNNTKELPKERDPRIESPNVRVVYPSDDNILKSGGALSLDQELPTKPQPATQQQNPVATTSSTTTNSQQAHTCTLTWLEALKQHSTFFLVASVLLIGLGFLIGKSK